MDVAGRNIGQAFAWSMMGGEAIQAIHDLRWMLVLVVILIAADFRFGMCESKKRHKEAVHIGNKTLAKMTEFHFSRAVRRTCNKFVDYMTLLLVFCLIGFAITEPYGICNHVITAGVAMIIACVCELCSIGGHFLYIKGITAPRLTWGNVGLFLGRLAAGFARTKSPDLGDALDETIAKTLNAEKQEEYDTDEGR